MPDFVFRFLQCISARYERILVKLYGGVTQGQTRKILVSIWFRIRIHDSSIRIRDRIQELLCTIFGGKSGRGPWSNYCIHCIGLWWQHRSRQRFEISECFLPYARVCRFTEASWVTSSTELKQGLQLADSFRSIRQSQTKLVHRFNLELDKLPTVHKFISHSFCYTLKMSVI